MALQPPLEQGVELITPHNLTNVLARADQQPFKGAILDAIEGLRESDLKKQLAAASKWATQRAFDVNLVRNAINTKVSMPNGDKIPIGLTTILGGAGKGKTTFVRERILNHLARTNQNVSVQALFIGEPGYGLPYSFPFIAGVLESAATSTLPPVLVVDSLMGIWFDKAFTSGFTTGKGGASFGVPQALGLLNDFSLAFGIRLVVVLHPAFADPDVIESGISGVSSMFIQLTGFDTYNAILRDYAPIDPAVVTIDELRYNRTGNVVDDNAAGSFAVLMDTIGDED